MDKKTIRRKFGGKTENFNDKQERNYEQKHLRAYLKGNQKFRIGQNEEGYGIYVPIKQEYYYE